MSREEREALDKELQRARTAVRRLRDLADRLETATENTLKILRESPQA